MSDRTLRTALGVLAASGVAVTVYLLYVRHTGGELLCTSGGCEKVQSSRYSEVFGVPVAALGLVAYLTLLATSFSESELARTVQAAVALAALAFSIYLGYVQLAVIDAVCQWCLISDGVIAAVAALTLVRLREAARA